MFNVSTINNKKTLLLALLLPTVINCSMVPTSLQNTIIDEKSPMRGGALVVGAGLAASSLIMLKSEEPGQKTLSMLSLACLGAGYATYKCLNYFTPTSRYNEVKKIINAEKEKAIWQNTNLFLEKDNSSEIQSHEGNSEEKSTNFKQLLNNIKHNHFGELDKTHLFIEKDLKPLFKNMQQAETRVNDTIKHLVLIESQKTIESESTIASESTKSTLLQELKKEAIIIKNILDTLVQIEQNIKDSEENYLLKTIPYHEQVEHFNSTEMKNLQQEKMKEKLENLKQQNTRFDLKLSTLLPLIPALMMFRPDIVNNFIDLFSNLFLRIQTILTLSA